MLSHRKRPVHRWLWRETPMSEGQLERIADLLLHKSAEQRPAVEYPFHSERQLTRKDGNLDDIAFRPPEIAPAEPPACVDGRWLTEVMVEAGLTRTERRCVRLLAKRLRTAEIAERLGLSRSHVSRSIRSAWRRLEGLVTGENPFEPRGRWSQRLFHEVYWSEVKRTIYRPPQCCPEGKERCKTLGYCPVRYLN